MNANDIIEKCAEIADAYADEQDKTVRASCVAKSIRALKSTYAPGMTDLMVFPESLDEFMEANPLPAETASEAMVEDLTQTALETFDNVYAAEFCVTGVTDNKPVAMRAAVESVIAALAKADDGWRPIESAPKDGTRFLWCEDYDGCCEVIEWPTYRECFERGFWRPLPAPPKDVRE